MEVAIELTCNICSALRPLDKTEVGYRSRDFEVVIQEAYLNTKVDSCTVVAMLLDVVEYVV